MRNQNKTYMGKFRKAVILTAVGTGLVGLMATSPDLAKIANTYTQSNSPKETPYSNTLTIKEERPIREYTMAKTIQRNSEKQRDLSDLSTKVLSGETLTENEKQRLISYTPRDPAHSLETLDEATRFSNYTAIGKEINKGISYSKAQDKQTETQNNKQDHALEELDKATGFSSYVKIGKEISRIISKKD